MASSLEKSRERGVSQVAKWERWRAARGRAGLQLPFPPGSERSRPSAPSLPPSRPLEAEQSRWGRKGGWKGTHLLIKKASNVTEVCQTR